MPVRAPRGVLIAAGTLRALAHACAALALAACAGGGAAPAGPFPQLAEYSGREVREVTFEVRDSATAPAEYRVPEDSISKVVTTRGTRCSLLLLPICPFGVGRNEYYLDLDVLARDVVRIQLLYRDYGYYGTRVVPSVQEADQERVDVRFAIVPGDLVTLTELGITGTEGVIPEEELLRRIPLKVNEPFRRIAFLASVDTVRNALLAEGHAYAQVLRNYAIDTIADVAQAELVAAPGPVVLVDTILFTGNYRLTEEIARRQLSVREGRKLTAAELTRSQRNLFDLELVQYATVEIAPESLQVTPDSLELDRDTIGSTVLVRVVEAPRFAVDASAGYGTVDCFRGAASHVDRNFLGGARRLEVSASVSKVGVGGPLDAGFDQTFLCNEFDPDRAVTAVDREIAQALNYRLAADFLQPRLFGTQTSVGANAYLERTSELGLYLRDRKGAQLGVIREIAPATVGSATFTVERGRTLASDLFFCVAFELCDPEDIATLQEDRWSNALSLGVIRSRVRLDPFPTGGYQLRAGTDYASGVIGSDDDYWRVLADGTAYRELRNDWVLSLRVMAGTFLQGARAGNFIPPERRFYAGGPTTVRGFGRNELGPTVYVRRYDVGDEDEKPKIEIVPSATGGTRTVVANVEVNFPSPFLRENLRLAAFLDAGQVWDADTLTVQPGIRFTPGVGARMATPVGPLRFDIGYNPYPREAGPLYGLTKEGELLPDPLLPLYRPPEGRSFWRRLAFHLSVGQTF